MGAREREAVLLPTTHREESIRPPPRTPEIRSARGNPTPNPSLDLPGSDGGAVAARRPVRGTRARHGARRRRRVLPVDGFNAVGGGGGCCPSSDIFNISSDTEVILHLIATSLSRPLLARICDACERLAGAYLLLWSLSSRRCEVLSSFFFVKQLAVVHPEEHRNLTVPSCILGQMKHIMLGSGPHLRWDLLGVFLVIISCS